MSEVEFADMILYSLLAFAMIGLGVITIAGMHEDVTKKLE